MGGGAVSDGCLNFDGIASSMRRAAIPSARRAPGTCRAPPPSTSTYLDGHGGGDLAEARCTGQEEREGEAAGDKGDGPERQQARAGHKVDHEVDLLAWEWETVGEV